MDSIFKDADKEKLGESEELVEQAYKKRWTGTQEKKATAVSRFLYYVDFELRTDIIRVADLFNRNEETLTMEKRVSVMLGFATFVTRTHKTMESTKMYVSDVNSWWELLGLGSLWPEECHKEYSTFFKGLKEMKHHVTAVRDGLLPQDVLELNLQTWK
jgi:hypothetical protein